MKIAASRLDLLQTARAASRRLLTGLVLIFATALLSCEDNPEPGTVPVEIRTGNDSSRSLQPLETSIYTYDLSPPDFGRSFRVTKQPPLRFAFPAAYYSVAVNFDGGPQAALRLMVDPVTFGPSSLTPTVPVRSTLNTPQQNEEHARRRMYVTVYSNLIGSRGVRRGADGLTIIRYDRSKERKLAYVGSAAGFSFYGYDDGTRLLRGSPPKLMLGPVDLYDANYWAYPENAPTSLVQSIDCSRFSAVCKFVFYYQGRQVGVTVQKVLLGEVHELAARIVGLLDRYNVDRLVR